MAPPTFLYLGTNSITASPTSIYLRLVFKQPCTRKQLICSRRHTASRTLYALPMASTFLSISMTHVVLSLMIFSSLQLMFVSSFEFQIGDKFGWVVPPSNDTKVYNDWASEKRFRVGDTIRFKYRKDSVMEVSETDYKRCNSTRPNFFSNTGNTIFSLDHSGYFYFISGAFGHCDKGQRMIVKVMGHDHDSPNSAAAGKSVAMFSHVLLPIATIHFLCLSYSHLF